MISLTGQKIFITGAGSGIGAAAARTLAEAGALVIVSDVNADGATATVEAIRAAGGQGEPRVLDVCDPAAILATAEAVTADHGAMDAVVNVAGWDRGQPFMENAPDFIEKIVQLNYLGQVRVCQAFLKPMIAAGRGTVVNIASDAGRVGSMGETVYAGAKGGVIAFTKSLAREMARHGITVNCVAPGPTETPLLADMPEGLQDALKRAIPLRRLGQPQDIANAILFFASNRASYITGQVLSVSGGLTMNG
ncbi:MAG: SDR family oxidoreductase [Alphaproteobacteria bacterium]|nr:SDR family oxidoreductase [Alphaproteobacteria bacterium]MCB9930780.1 SDR family oxidoreductase [Alphaproteobacteria bacterium]